MSKEKLNREEIEAAIHFQVFTDDQRWVEALKPALQRYGTFETSPSADFSADHQFVIKPDVILLYPSIRFGVDKDALKQLWLVNQHYPNSVICYFAAAPMEREAVAVITNGGSNYISLSYDGVKVEQQIHGLVQLRRQGNPTF